MADRLRFDASISIMSDLPMTAIPEALGAKVQACCKPPPSPKENAIYHGVTYRAVLVHCNRGHNRSPTLVILTFFLKTKHSFNLDANATLPFYRCPFYCRF